MSGDIRTVKAKKNILASAVLKGIDSLVYLLLVPVTLGYLNPYEYGIWLTLNSILMWINSFDIGLGNGLRNKLAFAVAQNDRMLGRIYVSTTFIMLSIIMLGIIGVGSIGRLFINWYDILNTTPEQVANLDNIVYVSFAIFCLNFILKLIGNIFLAMQLPAINSLMTASSHLLALIVIYILTIVSSGNLMIVAVVYTISPVVIYSIAYPITFCKVFPWLRPSIKCFSIKYLRSLFDLGINFFLLQLSAILLFSFSNLLISKMFGPQEVTPYNIAYRYFSIMPMLMNLILAPMWSATTDAYAKGEFEWIRNSMQKIRRILLLVAFGLIVMVAISGFVYKIWIDNEVKIPFELSCLMAVYILIIVVSLTYSNFLNGMGKLKIQTINTVSAAILFLPCCYCLGKLMGILGIVCGVSLLNLSGMILNMMQFYKVINNKAIGLWNK